MKRSSFINNDKCLEWGINATQGALFDLLVSLSTWAEEIVIDGMVFYWVAREKVCQELPLYYSKADTVYRHLKDLQKRGLIDYAKVGDKDVVALTAKGKTWSFRCSDLNPALGNKSETVKTGEDDGLIDNQEKNNEIKETEINPNGGNKSEARNEIRDSSEINPTDNNTSDYINTPYSPPKVDAVASANPDGLVGVIGDDQKPTTAKPRRRYEAPISELVAIYNEETAGVLPAVQKITDSRIKAVNARWLQFLNSKTLTGEVRYSDRESGLVWWRKFFRKVLLNERWCGSSGIEWTADFDWIVKQSNFVKILEWRPAKREEMKHAA